MKKSLFVIFMFFNILINVFSQEHSIAIFPFNNRDTADIDFIGELVQSALYSSFNNLEGYSVIHPYKTNEYLKDNNIISDLSVDSSLINGFSNNFNVDSIICGSFQKKGDVIFFNFEIIDAKNQKTIFKGERSGIIGFFVIDTVDKIRDFIVDFFSNREKEYSVFSINTDITCNLFIDDEYYGVTPFTGKLKKGQHWIKIQYKDDIFDNVIYNDIVMVSDEKNYISLKVMNQIEVFADFTGSVYIGTNYLGDTPITFDIPSNNEYQIDIKYNEYVYQTKVSTKEQDKLKISISLKGGVIFLKRHNNVEYSLNKTILSSDSYEFKNINPGNYTINGRLKISGWFINCAVYNKTIILNPFENKIVDGSNFFYKPKWALALLPGAMQINNNQYIKASLIISIFTTGSIFTAFSPLIAYSYYKYDYLEKVERWNKDGVNSNVSLEDIQASYNNTNYIFFGCLIGGVVLTLITFGYSIIDGIFTSNQIYQALNSGIKINNELTMNFDIIFK